MHRVSAPTRQPTSHCAALFVLHNERSNAHPQVTRAAVLNKEGTHRTPWKHRLDGRVRLESREHEKPEKVQRNATATACLVLQRKRRALQRAHAPQDTRLDRQARRTRRCRRRRRPAAPADAPRFACSFPCRAAQATAGAQAAAELPPGASLRDARPPSGGGARAGGSLLVLHASSPAVLSPCARLGRTCADRVAA